MRFKPTRSKFSGRYPYHLPTIEVIRLSDEMAYINFIYRCTGVFTVDLVPTAFALLKQKYLRFYF